MVSPFVLDSQKVREFAEENFFRSETDFAISIGAMADVVSGLIGGPTILYVLVFGAVCVLMQVFLEYKQYVRILKWLTLALFTYIGTLFFVKIDWTALLHDMVLPPISFNSGYLIAVVAIVGTTISPYLFFWQSAQEVEDIKEVPERKPLKDASEQAHDADKRINLDTLVGMGFSTLIALAIMVTAAATLHESGITQIESSAQAAEALSPLPVVSLKSFSPWVLSVRAFWPCRCLEVLLPMESGKP